MSARRTAALPPASTLREMTSACTPYSPPSVSESLLPRRATQVLRVIARPPTDTITPSSMVA